MFDRSALIATATAIASHKAEESIPTQGMPALAVCTDENLTSLLQGKISTSHKVSPLMWAAIVDAQKAADLLSKAEKAEASRSHFASSDYRAAANRKLAEAVSWLL